MLITSLVTTLLVFQAPPNKIEPPPLPDFQTRLDYFAWWQKQIKGSFPEDQNAYPLFARILAEKTEFHGLLEEKAPIGLWTAAEHPDWDKDCDAAKPLVDAFRQAAERSYYLDSTLAHPKVMLDLELPHLDKLKKMTRQNLDRGWRATSGKVDARELALAIRTNLSAARQLHRDPIAISYLVALAIRAMTYDSLLAALQADLLDAKMRGEILAHLRSLGSSSFEYALGGELAVQYDVIQLVKFDFESATRIPVAGGLLSMPQSQPVDLFAWRDAVLGYYNDFVSIYRKPYSANAQSELGAAHNRIKDRSKLGPFSSPI